VTCFDQRPPELCARVVKRLVDGAPRSSDALRENVYRYIIHCHALKDEPLSLGEMVFNGAVKGNDQLIVLQALKDWRRGIWQSIPDRVVELDFPLAPRVAPQASRCFEDRELARPCREPGSAAIRVQLREHRHQRIARGLYAEIVDLLDRATW